MNDISIIWLSIILALFILISAFFSGTETSMIAINRYRLKNFAKSNKRAMRALQLLENTDELIATILLGNNFVNIFASAITTIITIKIWGEGSVVIASLILTMIILIFAETAPKTFAAKNPEKIALANSGVIKWLIKIFKPIVYVINLLSNFFLRIIGISNNKTKYIMSAEELKLAVDDTKYVIADNYKQMLLNILDLEQVTVEDIMIPKNELIGFDIKNEDEIIQQLKHTQHTRLLVFDTSENNVLGILHMRDVANLYAKNKFDLESLKNLIKPPYFIPEGTKLSKQLGVFQNTENRLGLVINEYGELRGMVVLEDILEEIVGDFTSNQNESFAEIIPQKDGSYLINAKISIHEINQTLSLNLSSQSAKTLNGLLIEKLQDIPKHNMCIQIDNTRFEIMQVSDNSIKFVKICKVKLIS